jgi:hypothetical protein
MSPQENKSADPKTPDDGSIYQSYWDWYVKGWYEGHPRATGSKAPLSEELEWPGDEWGDSARIFKQLFVPAGVARWDRAVEIGPGSGKYTLPVIEHSEAIVRAYDVSSAYMEICRERCRDQIDSGRLELELLDLRYPGYMLGDLSKNGWRGTVDGFYSIAAMVHVDLQYLIVYLLTAALALKPGGKLIMTLATATNDDGFGKLVDDIEYFWRAQGRPEGSAKYEWLSPDLVESVLSRLGFEIDIMSDRPHRDLHFVASLADPERAQPLEPQLFPKLKRELRSSG